MDTNGTTNGLPALGAHSVPFAAYRDWKATNWHSLEPFRLSPRHARHAQLFPADSTEQQTLGEAFHAAILEPERFRRDFIAMPRFDGHPSSKAHKDAKAAWQAEHKHLIHLTADEWETQEAMGQAAREHRIAGPLLAAKGRNELSILWKEEETGILCKSRIDRLCRAPYGIVSPASALAQQPTIYLIDLKSTRNIEPFAFARDSAKYAYHAQMASYELAVQSIQPAALVVLIIAVENHPPYDVAVFRVGDEELAHGRQLFRRLLKEKQECEQSEKWPGLGDAGVFALTLPSYAKEFVDAA